MFLLKVLYDGKRSNHFHGCIFLSGTEELLAWMLNGSSTEFYFGMALTFDKGDNGMEIRFAVARTLSLGWMLVAATDQGVCFVALHDDPDRLRLELHDRFPGAVLREAGSEFSATVARVVACINNPGQLFDLPLHLQGTPFQLQVWQALREIPCGAIATYRDIAFRIGKPKALRAVGTACGANPIAIIVPCHRVIRSDGGLGGFRWGLERKRALLARENRAGNGG
jgi:AraC family transcriptional regulator of adaptative response/methylated-DNA-[protein]-cysteine methyltransferase